MWSLADFCNCSCQPNVAESVTFGSDASVARHYCDFVSLIETVRAVVAVVALEIEFLTMSAAVSPPFGVIPWTMSSHLTGDIAALDSICWRGKEGDGGLFPLPLGRGLRRALI